jgi:hypothetical protein
MSDYNRNKFMVHNGNNWKLENNANYIIFELLEQIRNIYKLNEEEFQQKMEDDPVFEEKIKKVFIKYYNFIFDEIDDEELDQLQLERKNNLKKRISIELLKELYNNREKVIENYKKCTNNNLIDK